MSDLQQSLEVLLGQKIQDDYTGLWHVYDDSGNEISDPSGILLRANPGALLHWPKESEDVIYSTKRKKKATVSVSGSINLPLLLNQKVTKEIKSPTIRKQLIQEDEEIVLIVQSLFISNILN